MRIIRILTLAALIISASVGFADVTSGYDPSVDFTRYRSFMWIKGPNSGSPLINQRIVDAVNFQLHAKGFYLVRDNADLAISASIVTSANCSVETFHSGLPADWDWHHYWGPQATDIAVEPQPERYEVGTLIIDLFDTQKKQSVWWGTAKHATSDASDESPKHFDKKMGEMFGGYQWWTTIGRNHGYRGFREMLS